MESTLIWHKPTEPIPANVEVVIIYRDCEFLELVNYKWKVDGVKSNFAGKPILAWAVCNVTRTAEMMMENFDKQWIDFLHKNATK